MNPVAFTRVNYLNMLTFLLKVLLVMITITVRPFVVKVGQTHENDPTTKNNIIGTQKYDESSDRE
jgi:hypothetical protein